MNSTRGFIVWVMIFLVVYTIMNWILEILQIKLYVAKESVGYYIVLLYTSALLCLFCIYKMFRLIRKIVYTQLLIDNHEFLASLLVTFFLINFKQTSSILQRFYNLCGGTGRSDTRCYHGQRCPHPNR